MSRTPIFNNYDANGYRQNVMGCRSSKVEDEAIVSNLRHRWPKELEKYSDQKLVNMYDEFAMYDEWFGNNDEKFLKFTAEIDEADSI